MLCIRPGVHRAREHLGTFQLRPAALLAGCVLMLSSGTGSAAQHALLVGISSYQDERIDDLEGPRNDVAALRDVLIQYWQFQPDNIVTLIDSQATEQAILGQLDQLASDTAPGDDIIVYFSGHGTSASDPAFGSRLHLPDGSGALVSSEFDPDRLQLDKLDTPMLDGLLIGRHELKPRLEALDAERHVLVMVDACFSGNAARGKGSAYTPQHKRFFNLLPLLRKRWNESASDDRPANSSVASQEQEQLSDADFRYTNTVYFGAAAEDQLAVDISQDEIDAGLLQSVDGKPHGGFTDALLRALTRSPSGQSHLQTLSHAHLFNRVLDEFATHCQSCNHTPVSLPQLADSEMPLLNRSIFNRPSESVDNLLATGDPGPDVSDQLLVYANLPDGGPPSTAMLRARSITAEHSATPDIRFDLDDKALVARAPDGQLVHRFEPDVTTAELQAWLAAREWLKRRMRIDRARQLGDLRVDFRHPLQSNRVIDGELVHFQAVAIEDSHLLILVLDAAGDLSVLYPSNEVEARTPLSADVLKRIPHIDQTPIRVTPPWGTDTVLFYAFPASHPATSGILENMLEFSNSGSTDWKNPKWHQLESLLDKDRIPYSMTSVRIVAIQKP